MMFHLRPTYPEPTFATLMGEYGLRRLDEAVGDAAVDAGWRFVVEEAGG